MPVPQPKLVFVGMQSSGKTSLIECICKLPVGYISPGTATRCPTEYRLLHDKDLAKPRVKVGGNDVEVEQVKQVVSDHMANLARQHRFDKTPLVVEITSADTPSLTFIDCPGLVTNDPKDPTLYQQLVEISGELPGYCLIVLHLSCSVLC